MNDSSLQRIPGVFVAPGATFASVARRPTWLAPLLCVLATGVVLSLVMTTRLDYSEVIRSAVEQRGVTLTDQQIDQQVAMMNRFGWVFGLLGVLIFQPVGFLVTAFVFWLLFKLQTSEMDYRTSLAVTLHGLLPLALASLLTLFVVLRRDSISLEELQGGRVLLSNLGALAPEGSGKLVRAALARLDFFSVWIFVLYGIGFRAASGLRRGAVTATVAGAWIAWYLMKVGWTALFS